MPRPRNDSNEIADQLELLKGKYDEVLAQVVVPETPSPFGLLELIKILELNGKAGCQLHRWLVELEAAREAIHKARIAFADVDSRAKEAWRAGHKS